MFQFLEFPLWHQLFNYQRRVFNSLQEFHAAWISLINKQDVKTTIVIPDMVPVPNKNNAPIYGEVDNVFCRTTDCAANYLPAVMIRVLGQKREQWGNLKGAVTPSAGH